jgi:DNA-binding NtrC family response regulator
MGRASNRLMTKRQKTDGPPPQTVPLRRNEPIETLINRLRDAQVLAKLVGQAPAFIKAIQWLPAIAKDEAAVLIEGETGTGKELIARAIHYLSERAPLPFVPVNCGALPETLLEDELFGHERGAFTDAHMRRPGLIAQAEKGTLFLDEVDTLTPKAQVALLRVLQDKKFRILGSRGEQEADVRVVAATNAPLDHLVQNGAFRADLYYRLCVFSIKLPPLRDRKEDIILLASYFLTKYGSVDGVPPLLSPSARVALISHSWPGNVRELESAIVRAIRLRQADSIESEDLGLPPAVTASAAAALGSASGLQTFKTLKQKAIGTFERDYLVRLMCQYQGNVSHAALAAGKERRELGKLLKKYQIDPKLFH